MEWEHQRLVLVRVKKYKAFLTRYNLTESTYYLSVYITRDTK